MTRSSDGQVYLVHFDRAIGHPSNPRAMASHYLGWAVDVDARMVEHRAGRGARILAACVQRGIAFEVVRTWEGVDRSFERRLKNHHNAWHHCPVCRPPGTPRSRAGPGPVQRPVADATAVS